ncbi:hypothetical protein ABT093_15880 [Kitasatospora sp. NPDC002551]|uniref:hypothetical protein n=1 Tax=Kitasatospora sp. NPDC002551 TaxID=3154539 RepID=UPI00332F21C9
MTLTPAVAALLGALIGGMGTLASAVLTQKATKSREHELRLWERQAAVYEDVLIAVRGFAVSRREMVRTGAPGEFNAHEHLSEASARVFSKLEIYGSRQAVEAFGVTFEREKAFFIAILDWMGQREPVPEGQTPSRPPVEGADPLWDRVLGAEKACLLADDALSNVLRGEMRRQRPGR